MPVARWLNGELKGLTLDMLSADRIRRQQLFNYDYVKRMLDEHMARERDHRKLLWTLLVFQLWYSSYIERT